MSKKEVLGTKIKTGAATLKKHWKTPPDGYYVNYKEFLNLALGSGSLSFLSVAISWTTIAINIPMMISYFKVSTGFIFVAGIVASVFGLIRAPILSMMIDNSNSPKGKFKPFLPWTAVLSAVCFTVIPFIPEHWVDNILFAFDIPAIPVFAVAASHIEVSLASLIMFLLIQIGTFFYTLLSQCLTGIEQTVSPVSQERANIGAFKGLISNIPSSVVNIIIPLVAGIVFASSKDPMNNIELYRFAFPVCSVGGIAFVFFTYFGTQERVVVHKEYVAKVKFSEGARQLFGNKYFWIITVFNIAVGIRGNINMYLWICNYGIGGQNGAFALTVCNMLLNNALVPGMLVGPWMIKKLGKRKVMLISTVGFTVMAFMQLLTLKSPYLMLVAIFFQNLFNGLSYISNIMVSDVLDYQQWKTGKRLEGFWQNCSSFVMTFCGLFTSALMPLFMSFGGVGFGDNIDTALKNTDIMYSTFRSVTWLGIISSVICVIPIMFYDLSEKKHADYIRALRIRAVVQNYKNNELSADDVTALKDIVKYAEENDNKFILNELCSNNETETILKVQVNE
ncbi:MAG: MFS transporter [Ruminococcus sp.]|nr:MFS transporter [Ruminococcus sp.]MDY3895472.1 MFS transporter [Candidatus Fimenecus sp.]